MPLLKFRCENCDTIFDKLVFSFNLDSIQCEKCGGPVERAYEGACLFGNPASSAGRNNCSNCSGGCSGCSSCHAGM